MSDIIYRNRTEADRQIGGVIGGAIGAATTVSSLATLYSLRAELALAGSNEMQFARNMGANIVSTMLTLTRYYFGNEAKFKPAAVISGIPLGTVTELSHAISDRMLKYRSKGGIFLAHQEGGDQTLRITGKAWGPNRYWFLIMLDFLFLYGQASTQDMFTKSLRTSNLISVSEIKKKGEDLPKGIIGTSPWAKIDLMDVEDGIEEKHLTFPVVTQDRIYGNMYIETYDYREAVELGMNVIEYALFFRKYIPKQRYKFATTLQEISADLEVEEIWYYSQDEDDMTTKRIEQIDLMTDLGFSAAMLVYRTYILTNRNSVELNTAMSFVINLNKQVMGDYKEEVFIQMLPEKRNICLKKEDLKLETNIFLFK